MLQKLIILFVALTRKNKQPIFQMQENTIKMLSNKRLIAFVKQPMAWTMSCNSISRQPKKFELIHDTIPYSYSHQFVGISQLRIATNCARYYHLQIERYHKDHNQYDWQQRTKVKSNPCDRLCIDKIYSISSNIKFRHFKAIHLQS